MRGIADGCRRANCGVVGGETAEMPSMYATAPASDERMQGRGGDDYVIDSYQKISESYYGMGREINVGEGEYYVRGEKKCRCPEEYS